MEALPFTVLDRAIQENEQALRASFGEDGLPDQWEKDLAALPRETPAQRLVYYARVKHWYWTRQGQLRDRAETGRAMAPEEAIDAIRGLLRREPVRVELAGRAVDVTGRSYNALVEIAAHWLRITELLQAVDHLERLHAETLARHPRAWRRRRVRRRLGFLRDTHGRLFAELLAHRRALYAHALTPDGAPAVDVLDGHPAPWWREASFEDDARLLLALYEVGAGRYHRLGQQAPNASDSPFTEDFGFHSLLTWIEGQRRLPPAALYDRDIGQVLAAHRAGTLSSPDTASLEG